MLVDVAKFCFIFVLIISSFSIGLAQLYWYTNNKNGKRNGSGIMIQILLSAWMEENVLRCLMSFPRELDSKSSDKKWILE